MAKAPKFENESLKDDGFGIGMNDKRELNSFPLSELPAKLAERQRQEQEINDAIALSEEDLDDISDL